MPRNAMQERLMGSFRERNDRKPRSPDTNHCDVEVGGLCKASKEMDCSIAEQIPIPLKKADRADRD